MVCLDVPLTFMRDEIAAMLLNRDEDWCGLSYGRKIVAEGQSAEHSGDCTKECHTCVRCQADRALADADRIISAVFTYI